MHFKLFLLLVSISYTLVYSQEDKVSPVLPPSPNTAAIATYGDIPVGEYTGTLNYTLPLYKIEYRDLSIPLSISYNSQGIKVTQEASEVGLGWAFNAGGVITRRIRGADDFGGPRGCEYAISPGYYEDVVEGNYKFGTPLYSGGNTCFILADNGNLLYQPYHDLAQWTNPVTGEVFPPPECLTTVGSYSAEDLCDLSQPIGLKDFESDLYSFSFGEYSGKFVISQDGSINTIESSDIKISVQHSDFDKVSWQLTTPDGTIYIFGKTDITRQLTYSSTIVESFPVTETPITNFCPFNSQAYISSWFLEEIITSRGEVITLNYEKETMSVTPVPSYSEEQSHAIDWELISQSNCGGPTFNPIENPHTWTRTATYIKYDDVKLVSIQTPYNNEVIISYSGRDDIIGTQKVENITVYQDNHLLKTIQFNYSYFESGSYTPFSAWFNPSSFIENTEASNPNGLEISGIPGGTYYFEDDLVKKRLKLESVQDLGDGSDELPKHEFKYNSSPLPPKHSFKMDAWGYANGSNNSSLAVEITLPNGLIIQGANRSALEGSGGNWMLKSIHYPTGGKTEIQYEPNTFSPEFYTNYFEPASNGLNIGGGFRVKSILDYSTSDNDSYILAKSKFYTYEHTNGQGETFSYGKIYNIPNLDEYRWFLNLSNYSCSNYYAYSENRVVRRSNSIYPLSNSYFGAFVGYDKVIVDYGAPSIGRREINFNNDIGPPIEIDGFTLRDWPKYFSLLNGKIKNDIFFDANNRLKKQIEYNYDFVQDIHPPNWNYSIHFPYPNSFSNIDIDLPFLCQIEEFTESVPHMYSYRDRFVRIAPSTITTTINENGESTDQVQEYTYVQQRPHVRLNTITGPGGSKTTTYRYPFDFENGEHQHMIDANMVGIPVEVDAPNGSTYKTDYHSTHLVPERFTEVFADGAGQIVHSEVTNWDGSYPAEISTFSLPANSTYTWDDGQLTSHTYKNHTQSWHYNDIRQMDYSIAIDGQRIDYEYDGLQRLEKIKARDEGIITDYAYTIGGPNEITSTTTYSDDDVVNTTRQTFDGLGRPLDNYVNGELQEGQRYDRHGRISTRTFMPGRWLNRIDYERSPLNRVRREVYPDGSSMRYEYIVEEGYNGVRVFDEKNNPTTTLTDVFGRTRVSIDALGGRTLYNYEIWDAPSEIIPPLGPKYEYIYNPLRQLETKTIPGGGTTTYRYDERHRLAATKTAQGDIVGNIYDDYSRLFRTYLREDGALPTAGTSFSPTGTDDLLTEDLYVAPGGSPQDDINRLMQSAVRFLDDSGNMIFTDYTYDDYGRVIDQIESFTLAGQSFTNTNTVNTAFLTHRDLPGRSINTLTNGTDNAQLGTFMGYDDFGRATSTGYKFGVSGPAYGTELASSWSATYDFDRHGQMSYKHYWQNPSGSWYGEDYSYNSRGWLTSINNRPAGRSFDADFCGQPDGNVYQVGGIEEEVTFEELLTLISEGESIHIEGTNVCPDDDDTDRPIQETCQEDIADSHISINLATGQPNDHPIPFQAPFGNVNSDVPVSNIQLTRLEADWFTFNRGQGEEFIFLSRSYDLFLKDYTTDVVDTTHIDAEHTALENELENWAIGQGYSVPVIDISYSGKSIDIQFLDANIEFINIKVEQSWHGIIPHPVPNQSTILTETRFKELRFTNDNYRKIDCSSVAAKGTGNNGNSYVGNLQSPNLPFKFYEVTVENAGTTYKEFLLPSEIAGITDKYTITNQYTVTSPSQTFTLEKESGSVVVTGIAGLVDARDDTNDRLVKVDMPTAENGETTTIPGTEQFCEIYDLPTCTEEEQLEQLAQVDAILADIDLDAVSYPYTLTLVMLCNGQTVWLPGDETTLSTLLTSGEVYYLDEVIANSANDLFHIVRKVPDALFSMDLEYERNGNIESATWKSTYHLRRQYAYGYDELNRIASADYSILPSPGVPMPTYGQGFTADNFTYDALGNILSLRRYAQLVPNTESELIDDLKYQYHGSLDPGEAAIPNQDLTARPDVSRLLHIDETGDNEFAKNHGFLPGDASSSDTYGYDDAGNLTTDPFKDITIIYNHLNLPEEIDGIKILYDASGRKWAMEYPDGTLRLYINGMEFEGGVFESINLGDGRIYVESSPGPGRPTNLIAEYWHKDHLGNIRVAFTDQNGDRLVQLLDDGSGNPSEVNQILDYYPFGLQHPGQLCAPEVEPGNAYRYNGKELLEDVGLYDYGARYYDPAIARWGQVDPLAASMARWSPYNYTFNNPIRFIDPDGMAPFADYYDQQGNFLASDGNNEDRTIHVVTDRSEARKLKRGKISTGDVSSSVALPSEFVRGQIGAAVDRSNSPAGNDATGGFHEEGGYFGTTSGVEAVSIAEPGSANPGVEGVATINVLSEASTVDVNGNEGVYIDEISGTFHVHPSGERSSIQLDGLTSGSNTSASADQGGSFIQSPNGTDVPLRARRESSGTVTGPYSVVAGAGNNTAYLYNGSGTIATFPLDKFRSVKVGN